MLPERGDYVEKSFDLHLSQIAVHTLINKATLRFDSDSCLFIFRLFDNTLTCPSYDS